MTPTADPAPTPAHAPRFRSQRARVVLGAVLGPLLLLAVYIAAFDATWLRPLIQHHIHERSGRRVDFDELHIGLNRELQPTVSLRNLVVQNAPWAAKRPFVRAATLGFTLSWESLRGGPVTLTTLTIVDAELDLERQADGLRNWRLTRPDDRGPGRVRVRSLDARNTNMHVVDQAIGLELDMVATPLASSFSVPAAGPARPELPLTRHIALYGTRDGVAFDGRFAVSELLTFFDTGQPFALRGELRVGQARAHVEGVLTDLAQLARADLDLRVAGPRLAGIGRVFGVRVPAFANAAEASGHVTKEGERWAVRQLRAKLGRSDLAGEAQFDRKPPAEGRALLRAALTGTRIDVADLRAPSSSSSQSTETSAPHATAPPASNVDADIDLKIGAVEGLPLGSLTQVSAHGALRGGRWVVDPAAFVIAGGAASGTLVAETAATPATYALDLRLRGMQIEQLVRAAPSLQPLAGRLDARIAMQSRGDSFASLAGAATGTLHAELLHATISEALDAKLGLDGGRLLRTVFGAGSERTPVTCSALDVRFDAGRGTARRLAFETPQIALSGAGWIDLGGGTLHLLLTPRRKQSALLALDRTLQVSGALKAPKVALISAGAARTGEPCVAGRAQ